MWYFILGIIVAWFFLNHFSKKKMDANLSLNKGIDEEQIQEQQESFENFMVYSSVPTALYADSRARYFKMKEWFVRLDERNSHTPEKQQQIRQDWLTYLYLLDHGATKHYLWLEAEEDESSEIQRKRSNEATEANIRVGEIEDRFAGMIGSDAETFLKESREKDFGKWMKEERQWQDYLLSEYKKEKQKAEKTEK